MTAPVSSPRYERKFIARGCTLPDVLSLVRRHPAVFREVYPPRVVNNIYFDTPSLRDYHLHVSGAAERAKTRLRWYGHTNGQPVIAALERKVKRGLLSAKTVVATPPVLLSSAHTTWRNLFKNLEFPENWSLLLAALQPSLFNSYKRRYFLSGDGSFRLTVDSDLRFSPPELQNPAFPPPGSYPPIIELKYAPEHAHIAPAVSSQFPVRLCRCSKYILGIEHLAHA